ncbi:MAG: hypothetical protein U0U67_12585 [Chitinophagales bacterium]
MAKRTRDTIPTVRDSDISATELAYPFRYATPFWIVWGKRTIDGDIMWNIDETTRFYITQLERGAHGILITYYDTNGNRIEEMSGEIGVSKGMFELRVGDYIRNYENDVRRTGYCTILSKIPLLISGAIFKETYGTNFASTQDSRTIEFTQY